MIILDGVFFLFTGKEDSKSSTLYVNYRCVNSRANSPDYDSICAYNIRLHLHICIFACMQIVPGELRPPRNLYVVMYAGE